MNLEKIAVGALSALARHEGKKIYKKQGYAEKPASAKPIRMQNPADDGFRCGFASRITMPKNIHAHPYYLAGHRTGKTVAGILDPLTVSALWLDCKDGGGMVVIGADVVGIANMEIAQIRDALQDFCRETGCKSISILCSHNHAGIDTLGCLWCHESDRCLGSSCSYYGNDSRQTSAEKIGDNSCCRLQFIR